MPGPMLPRCQRASTCVAAPVAAFSGWRALLSMPPNGESSIMRELDQCAGTSLEQSGNHLVAGGTMQNVVDRVRDTMGSDRAEGSVTKMIEEQTAKVPSGTYLSLGIGAMALSWLLLMGGRTNLANFIGQWVPTILIVGLYNKLVKVEGHD